MKLLLLGLACLLFVFFLGATSCNWWVLFRFVCSRQTGSLIPFVGGLAGVVALLIVPVPTVARLCWLPLVLDLGSLPLLLGLLVRWAGQSYRHGR